MSTEQIEIIFGTKDAADTKDYFIGFAATLAAQAPGVLLTSLTWSVVAIPGDLTPLSIVAHSEDYADPLDTASGIVGSTIRLTAGTENSTYIVRCHVLFSDGETDTVSFFLPIGKT